MGRKPGQFKAQALSWIMTEGMCWTPAPGGAGLIQFSPHKQVFSLGPQFPHLLNKSEHDVPPGSEKAAWTDLWGCIQPCPTALRHHMSLSAGPFSTTGLALGAGWGEQASCRDFLGPQVFGSTNHGDRDGLWLPEPIEDMLRLWGLSLRSMRGKWPGWDLG